MPIHGHEIEISGGRKVFFAEHKASDLPRIYATAGLTGEEPGPLLATKVAVTGLQMCIRQVGAEKVDFSALRERWDELFTFRDQNRLVDAWNKVHFGEAGEGKVVPVAVTIS